MRVVDPALLEKKLPPYLLKKWLQYFDYKDKRFDKLEYYLVQLSALIAAIGGMTDTDKLIWDRGGKQGGGKKQTISPDGAMQLLRAVFGV